MADYYDRLAGVYDTLYTSPYSLMENRIVQQFLQPFQACTTILDIGAGTGLGYNLLHAHPGYIGLDPARNMARRGAYKTGAPFINAVGESLPFRAGYFDGVIAIFTVASYMEPYALAFEVQRVLRPGGRFLLMGLNRYAVWRVLRGATQREARYYSRDANGTGCDAVFWDRYDRLTFQLVFPETEWYGLSWFGAIYEGLAVVPIDRLLCRVAPFQAHSFIARGVRHA